MMCLAVPARVAGIQGKYADVDIQGNRRKVAISLVPGVQVGDYVLVHAGYALQVVDEQEARETLRLLKELYGSASEFQGSALEHAHRNQDKGKGH